MAKLLKTAFVVLLLTGATYSMAQQTIALRKLWVKPQVVVQFGAYRIWFTIKDIEKAMSLLTESDQAKYGITAALDTNREYAIELLPGRHLEYRYPLQDIMQNAVGAFLLYRGHAYIETGRHKKIHSISMNIGPPVDMDGYLTVAITVYDPKTNAMIFSGIMNAEMYYKDLGLD
ncbi:MAG: hypothetical protein P4L41_15530 [Flavipsychrobacter sp.]|nr:hypothetical protein [Flavipsychrobacter sp.]